MLSTSVYRLWLATLIIIVPLVWSDAATARQDREGFNLGIGASFLANAGDERSAGDELFEKNESSRQALNLHLGYAFEEVFNLGLNLSTESQQQVSRIKGDGEGETIARDSKVDLRSYNLFVRFLFGRYFYLEIGGGAYDYDQRSKTEFEQQLSETEFSSTVNNQNFQGLGAGYHFGAGVEIPLKYGFYFVGSFRLQNYSMRLESNSESGAEVRKGRGNEFIFGIHHYSN